MTDQFLGRDWADNHDRMSAQLAAGLGTVFHTIQVGLDRLNAYEFDAPWLRDLKRGRVR